MDEQKVKQASIELTTFDDNHTGDQTALLNELLLGKMVTVHHS